MFKQNVNIDGKTLNTDLINLGKSSFGQRWSVMEDTDAMWRIYSPDKKSVQIITTFEKVLNEMKNPNRNAQF